MKRVITLNNEKFAEWCAELIDEIRSKGFIPDVIVGIQTGGEYVAKEISKNIRTQHVLEVVCLQRSSTPKKKRIKKLISLMPLWVSDILRIIESKIFSFNKKKSCFKELPDSLKGIDSKSILLCDDAVDSGATMLAVLDKLKMENPKANIKTASLTVTTPNPLILPDYFLSKNLLRFPWSLDMKIDR